MNSPLSRMVREAAGYGEIFKVSDEVFKLAEIGSREFKTSRLLSGFLRRNGFSVKIPYKGMKTSFRAECGAGKPAVCFLCEEDALPNGHSCGHNLIAAWAVGSAVKLKERGFKGRIVVIGTPAEEGAGEYAGSKSLLIRSGAFDDIDFAFGFHPDVSWSVGCISPLNVDIDLIFLGRASSIAEPDKGRNALDALVDVYSRIEKFRSFYPKKKTIIGMHIKEGGKASNIITDHAVLSVDLRSMDIIPFNRLRSRIEEEARRIGKRHGVKVKSVQTTPVYERYVNPIGIDEILYRNLRKHGIKPVNLYTGKHDDLGATDEANVSRVVPTGHIDMKIAPGYITAHSDVFRGYAGSKEVLRQLRKAIEITVESCVEIADEVAYLPWQPLRKPQSKPTNQ